jgi:hypothetical protein
MSGVGKTCGLTCFLLAHRFFAHSLRSRQADYSPICGMKAVRRGLQFPDLDAVHGIAGYASWSLLLSTILLSMATHA